MVPARRGAGVTAGAWKASAGALARVPVARAANLARTLASYQDAGLFVAGLDAAGDTPVRDLELATAPLVLVIGSEGRGLSRIVARTCDVLVRIPIAARTESLERRRSRRHHPLRSRRHPLPPAPPPNPLHPRSLPTTLRRQRTDTMNEVRARTKMVS